MTYLDVNLKAGERWVYQPPKNHNVAWIALHEGTVRTPSAVSAGEALMFEEGDKSVIGPNFAGYLVFSRKKKLPPPIPISKSNVPTPMPFAAHLIMFQNPLPPPNIVGSIVRLVGTGAGFVGEAVQSGLAWYRISAGERLSLHGLCYRMSGTSLGAGN
jgi:hypothetical protein